MLDWPSRLLRKPSLSGGADAPNFAASLGVREMRTSLCHDNAYCGCILQRISARLVLEKQQGECAHNFQFRPSFNGSSAYHPTHPSRHRN